MSSGEPVVEYGERYSGGGYLARNRAPEIEAIYPLAEWIEHTQRHGTVYRRTIIIVEDWAEVPPVRAGA